MKKIYTLLITLFTICGLQAQNLVPNPSFEDTVFCPTNLVQVDACQYWMNFGNSPDYYNGCSPAGLRPPDMYFGFQYPHSGNAITGLITYQWQFGPDWPNYREFIGVELLYSLEIGQKYYMSFFVNCAGYLPNWQIIGANKIGIRFSTIPYNISSPPLNKQFFNLIYRFDNNRYSQLVKNFRFIYCGFSL